MNGELGVIHQEIVSIGKKIVAIQTKQEERHRVNLNNLIEINKKMDSCVTSTGKIDNLERGYARLWSLVIAMIIALIGVLFKVTVG